MRRAVLKRVCLLYLVMRPCIGEFKLGMEARAGVLLSLVAAHFPENRAARSFLKEISSYFRVPSFLSSIIGVVFR
jgi:hypothetical protein